MSKEIKIEYEFEDSMVKEYHDKYTMVKRAISNVSILKVESLFI